MPTSCKNMPTSTEKECNEFFDISKEPLNGFQANGNEF